MLTTQLLNRGFQNIFLQGLHPLHPNKRMIGYTLALRYVPAREDLADKITTTT